jgi:ATP adenylyltransferase
MSLRFHNLFSPGKMDYIKGNRPSVSCILCAIHQQDPEVQNLLVCQGRLAFISVNKFPYNSGHLLICPNRHVTDYRGLSNEEEEEMNGLLRCSLDILDGLYHPSGYNVGFNIGEFAGASLQHIHTHVIPRYRNEVGFIDIVGGAKILIEDPQETMRRLREAFDSKRGTFDSSMDE